MAALLTAVAAHAANPPNFVFILGEGHGWSSTSVQMDDAVPASKSSFVRTPNLEKLAAGGMRFANFYAPSPRCTPSRVAVFTGKSPAQLHMTFIDEGKRDSGDNPNGRVLAPSASMELPTTRDDHRRGPEARGLRDGAFRQVAHGPRQPQPARLRRERRRERQRRPGQRRQSASQTALRHDGTRDGFHGAAGEGGQAVLSPALALRRAAGRGCATGDASPP